jgi:hypothetical protein
MARAKAPPTRIQRAGNGHTYYIDGDRAPGVTTILGDGLPKPALMSWAAGAVADFVVNRLNIARKDDGTTRIVADDLVRDALAWNATRTKPTAVGPGEELPRLALAEILKNIRYRDLDETSNRGSEVHKFGEKLARGQAVEVPEELVGHVKSYVRFLNEWQPTNALVERVIVNRRWGYMGKLDLIADFPVLPAWIAERIGKTSGRGLLDIKTARSGIFAEVALQLEAYRHGETMLDGAEEIPMPEVDFVAAIWVRADGYDVYSFDVDDAVFRTFLYVKQVAEWLDWKNGPAATIKSPALHLPRRES